MTNILRMKAVLNFAFSLAAKSPIWGSRSTHLPENFRLRRKINYVMVIKIGGWTFFKWCSSPKLPFLDGGLKHVFSQNSF